MKKLLIIFLLGILQTEQQYAVSSTPYQTSSLINRIFRPESEHEVMGRAYDRMCTPSVKACTGFGALIVLTGCGLIISGHNTAGLVTAGIGLVPTIYGVCRGYKNLHIQPEEQPIKVNS